jgi:hypothetical protein
MRKRSFRVGYVFLLSFVGTALGLMLAHRAPTSSEFQGQSLTGGLHGPEHADGEAIPESADISPRMSSPEQEKADEVEASSTDAVYRRMEPRGLGGDPLVSLLYDFTRITPADIPRTLSIQEFAAHVAGIATEEIWTVTERISSPEDPTVTDIRFGTSPSPSESTESPRTRFSTYDTRIFAVFDTSTYAYPSVLLKWYRIDQPELLIFQKYEIDPHAASNYVWYKKQEGWPNGQYRVEVYSLGEDFRMMSSGQYEVSQN